MFIRTLAAAFLLAAVGLSLNAVDVEAQCERCFDFAGQHYFMHGQQEVSHYCDGDGECHVQNWTGSCDGSHTECMWREEDADAFAAVLETGDAGAVAQILSPLADQGKLTFVADRQLLLVTGCDGLYTAGFVIKSTAVDEGVRALLYAASTDH